MFKKRRAAKAASNAIQSALGKIVVCFHGDPDAASVRASVVLHHGEQPDMPYGVMNFGFDDDDRPAVYMDSDLTVLVYEAHMAPDVATGENMAKAWVGEDGEKADFAYLPGIYQSAYVEYVAGVRQEPSTSHWVWALEPINGYQPIRKFPPPASGPERQDRSFVAMPEEVVAGMFADRGW